MACSCLPPPASLRAPKVYNILVPDVFPRHPPSVAEPLPEAQLRKIGKLAEYVRNNPAKIPKVSRRLYRQVVKSLPYPAQAGHVVIAAETYTQLLRHCQDDNAPYGSTFFTPELLMADKPLIQTLLSAAIPELRIAGSRLFSEFVLAQDSTAHVGALSGLVGQVCSNLEVRPGAAEEAAMMQALQSYVEACAKLSLVPDKLEEMQGVLMRSLQAVEPERKEARETAGHVARQLKECAKDLSSIHTMIHHLLHQGALPSAASLPLSPSAAQAASGPSRSKLQRSLESLSRGMGDHRFTLLSSLLQHVAEPGVSPRDTAESIQVVTSEAVQLPDEHAAAILALALQLLPQTLTASTLPSPPPADKDTTAVKAAAHKCIQQLAVRVGSLQLIYATVYNSPAPNPTLPGTVAGIDPRALDCALIAMRSMHAKGLPLECQQLPPSCVSATATILATADTRMRLLAHSTLDPLAASPKALQDPNTAAALQAALAAEAVLADTVPKELPFVARLWRACIAAQPASFTASAAAAVIQVAQHIAGLDAEFANPRRACAVLMVVNSVLEALQLPAHYQLDVQAGCPEVKATAEGVSASALEFPATLPKIPKETLVAAQHRLRGTWEQDVLEALSQAHPGQVNGAVAAVATPTPPPHSLLQLLGNDPEDDDSPRHLPFAEVDEVPEVDMSSVHIRVHRGTTDPGQELLAVLE